jgi:hypothetical protein
MSAERLVVITRYLKRIRAHGHRSGEPVQESAKKATLAAFLRKARRRRMGWGSIDSGGTMARTKREWASLQEAAQQVGVSLTTLREWCRSGAVETRGESDGRVVDLAQVRDKAMGPAAPKRPSTLQDRVADSDVEGVTQGEPQRTLTRTLRELQELARERFK